MRLVSPDDMLREAKERMLAGKDPSTREDWHLVFNFFAVNVVPEAQPGALYLIAEIYDAPLSRHEIDAISKFQIARKS